MKIDLVLLRLTRIKLYIRISSQSRFRGLGDGNSLEIDARYHAAGAHLRWMIRLLLV